MVANINEDHINYGAEVKDKRGLLDMLSIFNLR